MYKINFFKNKKSTQYILLLVIFSLYGNSNLVCAKNWVGIKDSDLYVDTDSKQRSGDLVTIDIKVLSGKESYVEFDCKKGTANTRIEGVMEVKKIPALQKIYDIACKRSWEIWK